MTPDPDHDPPIDSRQTRDGSGPRWELIREAILDRDEHTCKRCGVEFTGDAARRLEVHNTAPFGEPSMAELERLVTVCRPCHATLHGDDPSYGDLREDAPFFPRPDAPPSVSTMRSNRHHVCQRCQYVADEATELAAYIHEGHPHVLCKPCAGALLEAGYDPGAFETAGDVDVGELRRVASSAPVRPALLAPRPVRTRRPPRTKTERIVHDTPLRYAFNPIGFTLLFLLFGVSLSMFLL